MGTVVRHEEGRSRYEIFVDDRLAGFAQYRRAGAQLDFTHTEVSREFGGRGLGTLLVAEALADVERASMTVVPSCWFVRDHIAEHAELLHLVPTERRRQFGLPAG